MNIVKTKSFKPDSEEWTPRIIDGDGYCSPACAGRCTIEKFNSAVKMAEHLAERMGEDWTPVVWENLGWHSKITRPNCEIYIHGKSCWINMTLPGFGQITTTTDDP